MGYGNKKSRINRRVIFILYSLHSYNGYAYVNSHLVFHQHSLNQILSSGTSVFGAERPASGRDNLLDGCRRDTHVRVDFVLGGPMIGWEIHHFVAVSNSC